jgi:para-nitrobenzyl esterase
MLKLLLLTAIVSFAGCEQSPPVVIDGEQLVGKQIAGTGITAFLGIPFAEPPVGELRWRAPQPLKTKQRRRDTTEFAAACMQSMRILDWYRYMAETFGASADYYEDLKVSEDCLYLNLWTPTFDPSASLPVMVWIHGGSNKSGWSYENNYRGHVLAPQGVVVVTVAYRQGAFGFLSHPELADEDAVANFGLWDLIAALQWIQRNIAQFGGDPNRVTLFGESAGAENILALMFAEASRDLFHRAILQSTAGYGLSMPTLEDEQQRGTALAGTLGIRGEEALEQLRQVSAEKLLAVYTENFPDHYHSPSVDGRLITESTWTSIQSGYRSDHQLIIGTNADESTDRRATARKFICPSQNVAANMSASGGNARMYFFSRIREDEGAGALGAYHGAEYPYVFGTHDAYMTTNQTDLTLSTIMQQYWINFAATGNPNTEGLPEWPLFERPDPLVQELGDEVRTIPAIEPEMCASFEAWNASRN